MARYLVILLFTFGGLAYAEEKAPLLVIIDAERPLAVDYRSGGKLARNLILLGGVLNVAIDSAEAKRQAEELQNTVGSFDRAAVVNAATRDGIKSFQHFAPTVVPSGGAFGTVDKPDFRAIRQEGFNHVLAMDEEFAGLITAWERSTLSATSRISYALFDAQSRGVMTENAVNGFAQAMYSYEEAIGNRDQFLNDYPLALGAAIGRMLGELAQGGHLHLIAASYGLGSKVPDTTAVLRQFEDRFSYRFRPPRGWEEAATNTKYSTILQPKDNDKMKLGLTVSFDLLVPEFAQDFDDPERYADTIVERVARSGFEPVPNRFTELELDQPHVVRMLENPTTGAVNLIFVRVLDENFVVMYTLVLLADFDRLYKKHRDAIERIINTVRIRTD